MTIQCHTKEISVKGEKDFNMKKRGIKLVIAVLCLICTFAVMDNVQAASKATRNKKAKAAFAGKLGPAEGLENLVYADVTGDGVVEALLECHPQGYGSGRTFRIYKYSGGKVKKILSMDEYGLSYLYYYKKSKSIILYGSGHGGEWYSYYTMKKGKYKFLAERSREALAGGGMKNGSWYYYKGSKELTKSKFKKLTGNVKKGKRKKIKTWEKIGKAWNVLRNKSE